MEDISPDAINAVARSLYGETEYDALPEGQVKAAYRKRARIVIGTVSECEQHSRIISTHVAAE
ncbi:hypothetical protein [Pseudarthrobacter sp. fls2-241-R2A-127]|uniref:hypothetical protein n=1 Tax=Pseudarthrobacter sp. fls2-241-R2A-127 TaxID=3040303 RepID=UPI0025527C0C|nr:hypothetical protein [Pseudarthrobacter sp. fls2-241-R2A-127]